MSYSDVIKKSVMEGFSYADMSTSKIIVTLVITFAIAVYIYFVYKLVTREAFYYKNFNVSMAIISVVTAGIILAMQSSIVISLGMVGALSIVRFRTAIKDPMDLLFLFWSIGTGIICGAGLYKVAIILAVLVTVGIMLLELLPLKMSSYLLIINASSKEAEDEIMAIIKQYVKGYTVKSKSITKNGLDMIIEIRSKQQKELLGKLTETKDVESASLLMHDGEVKSNS